jgi:hypothetical protein
MVDIFLIYKKNLSEKFLADPGDHHAASSRILNRIFKLLLLLELAYDLTQTWQKPRKHLWLLFDEADS